MAVSGRMVDALLGVLIKAYRDNTSNPMLKEIKTNTTNVQWHPERHKASKANNKCCSKAKQAHGHDHRIKHGPIICHHSLSSVLISISSVINVMLILSIILHKRCHHHQHHQGMNNAVYSHCFLP